MVRLLRRARRTLLAAYTYRGFIGGSIRREFQSRYSNSVLGGVWTVLNPLAMITVYTVVFSEVMRARLAGTDDTWAYGIFLCAGLLTWNLFAEITQRCLTMFLGNANLLKKLNFPRVCLPIIAIGGALLNFAIIFGLFLGFLLLTGHWPQGAWLALLPLLALQILFCSGLGLVLGLLNVFFRDVGQFFGIALQFWFWLTPIVYPLTILPARVAELVRWNPMTALMVAYQEVFLHARWPHWATLLPLLLASLALCTLGIVLYRARAGEMVDEL